MAMKAMLKTLDSLDEGARKLYRKEGEAYVLDVEAVDGWSLENVTGLKASLIKEREAAEDARKKLGAFGDLDPSTAREALEKVEKMKSWTPDDKVREQIELRTREVAAAKDAEIRKLNERVALLAGAHAAATLERELVEAATKAKFVAPQLAPKLFRDQVDLLEQEGRFVPVVKGADGKPVQVVNGDGSVRFKTLAEHVAEQAKQEAYAPLIAANSASGTQGANQGQSRTGGPSGNGNPDVPVSVRLAETDKEIADFFGGRRQE